MNEGEGTGGKADREQDSTLTAMARYSGHGLTLALSMGLFLLVGWWVDGRVGTKPLFTVVGALVGASAGFYHLIHHLLVVPRKREAGEGKDRTTDPGPGKPES